MPKLRVVLRIVDAINERFGKIISFLVLGMMGLITLEVALRYVLNLPTIWAHETVQFFFGAYCILGGAYVLLHKAHVNMDIIYNRFSLRKKAILDLVTSSLFFIFIGVMLWQGAVFAWKSVALLETSMTPWGPPVWPVKLTLPLAALLLLLQGIVNFLRDIETVVAGREARAIEVVRKETL